MIERLAWVLVCALVFTIPWEKSVYIAGLGTVTRVIGIAAIMAGAVAAVRRREIRRPNLALVAAAVFVLWASMTWFWSYDRVATVVKAFTFTQLFVLACLIWDQCRARERELHLLATYIAGCTVASVWTIARYAENLQTYYRRYAAAGFDPNDLGLTLALSIPLALYVAMQVRGWKAWLPRASILLTSVAILLTASRSALVAAFLGFVFAVWTWRKSDRVQRMSAVALFAFLIAGSAWLAPKASRERISTLGAELTTGTLHNRTRIWKTGLKVLKQRPIVGVGAGAFPDAVRPWLGVPGVPGHEYVAHNAFLSVLVETGVVGFGLFAILLVALAGFVYMMQDTDRALWSTVLLVWAAGVATLTWEHRKPTWLIFALIMTAWARAWREAPVRASE